MQRITDQPWTPFGQYAQPARAERGRERTRWLWAVPLALGLLAAGGWILSHDPAPGLALSPRGWITVATAVVVAIALATHRRAGQLLHAIAEFAAVATLAVLLATASAAAPAHSPAKPQAQSRAETIAGACPPINRPVAWASCVWAEASKPTTHTQPPPTTHQR
jgi:uncharacterized membrane protein